MSEPPAAQAMSLSAAKDKEGAAGRSRVYIACSLCRQRKIKCGGEQPACRNCTRVDLECRYDSEPKRRGPDKKPGTRTRTRKDSAGAVLPPKSRVQRAPQTAPASSNEPLLVPSQAGPARNKKRAPRGLPLDQPARVSRLDERALPLPNEGSRAGADPIYTISPPTLPHELGHIVPSSTLGRGAIGRSPPRGLPGGRLDTPRDQVSPPVRLPQLPTLPTRPVFGEPGPSNSETRHDTHSRVSDAYDGSTSAYANDTYDRQGGIFLPEQPAVSPSTIHTTTGLHPSSNSLSTRGPQPEPLHIAPNLPSTASTSYITPISNPNLGSSIDDAADASIPGSLFPTTQPTSPVFTRLQHTNDPHFRPPADVFAGLAYPRAGLIIPALGRGNRAPGSSIREESALDSAEDSADGSLGLGLGLRQSDLGQVTGAAESSREYATGEYSSVAAADPYVGEYATLGAREPAHQTPIENTYSDYSGRNYVAQASDNYGYPSDRSYSTHTDVDYLPPSESNYATPVGSYASHTGGYSPAGPMPAEITILPPPVGGLVGVWRDGTSDGGNLYEESDNSASYISGVYGSVSDVTEPATEYDDAPLTESEGQSQIDTTSLSHRRYQNQFAQRMFYNNATSWVSEPSVAFARKTWWDNLLEMYAPTKGEAARQVTSDLKYLFKSSNYWLSFLNVNLFMTEYNHRERRENIQPALILAALAYSTFTQSSEIERGHEGRVRAMELRSHAQSALEASLNSQRLDPTLAQAAWILALFEISAHPEHSTTRSHSALIFLDGIIRLLGLTVLDVMDPQATVFSPEQVPRLALSPKHNSSSSDRQFPSLTAHDSTTVPATCACHALSIACTTTHVQLTPFWVSSPGWDPTWSEMEIRREESRRLVWSSLTLAAGFTAHDAAFAKDPTELHLIHASNYALCFPGELMMRGIPNAVHSPQENVWALYGRAMLLWNSCLMLRKAAGRMTEAQRAEFAVNVWLETNTIEEALNRHTCGFERNSLFQGREYLFNTRMFISWEFRRYIPSPDTEVHQQFHRRKAEEWLRHQAEVAKRLMQGLHTVTGLSSNVLGKRPYFVWWFMAQVSRCLSLWQCDRSLLIALEVARAFLPPIDYLTCLWPCQAQRTRYYDIRQRLHNECVKYGLEPPPPPQLVIPTAIF